GCPARARAPVAPRADRCDRATVRIVARGNGRAPRACRDNIRAPGNRGGTDWPRRRAENERESHRLPPRGRWPRVHLPPAAVATPARAAGIRAARPRTTPL